MICFPIGCRYVGFVLFPRRKATSDGIILSTAQFTSSSSWDYRRVGFQREISTTFTPGVASRSVRESKLRKSKKCFVSLSFGMCVRGMAPTCLRNQTNDPTGCRAFFFPLLPFSPACVRENRENGGRSNFHPSSLSEYGLCFSQ